MTNVYNVQVIVGSIRSGSLNRVLAQQLMAIAPADFQLQELNIGDLPLYSEDHDSNLDPAVKRLKAAVAAADGILFVTPEYNRSIPGVLKNAIDQASRPYGDNSWTGKPAGIVGISLGTFGTAMAQQHLRNILAYLDMPTLGQPEVYLNSRLAADNGSIRPETLSYLQEWMDVYAQWVRHHAQADRLLATA